MQNPGHLPSRINYKQIDKDDAGVYTHTEPNAS